MKTEQLKRILPLYLRAKVLQKPIIGNKAFEREIKAITSGGLIELSKHDSDSGTISNVKSLGRGLFLLLRPLSSMTEEEAKEICEEMGHCFLGIKYKDESHIDLLVEKVGVPSMHGDRTITFWNDGDISDSAGGGIVSASIIPFLTSKGFDCFGLIDAGIAKPIQP